MRVALAECLVPPIRKADLPDGDWNCPVCVVARKEQAAYAPPDGVGGAVPTDSDVATALETATAAVGGSVGAQPQEVVAEPFVDHVLDPQSYTIASMFA